MVFPIEANAITLAQAEQQGATSVAEVGAELERIGPSGLWIAAARGYLSDHGFVQSGDESFAETIARVLGIGTDQLRMLIAQGHIVSALLERLGEVR